MEAVLALQHIFRVARAVGVDPSSGIECAVAYVVHESDVSTVAETWRGRFEMIPPSLAVVVVEGLPRGARVEWHIIRCRKTSEDEMEAKKAHMAFEQHEVITAINEFSSAYGVLCIIFGSSQERNALSSRYKSIAIQNIPSKAVYSISSTNEIKEHSSCTIVLAD